MGSTFSSPVATTMNPDIDGIKINQCCICYNTYNRTNRAPVSMPCGHTFCRYCYTRQTTANKRFKCGVCRKISRIGRDGTEKNLALIQILESLHLLDTDDSVENNAEKLVEDVEAANSLDEAVSSDEEVNEFDEITESEIEDDESDSGMDADYEGETDANEDNLLQSYQDMNATLTSMLAELKTTLEAARRVNQQQL